MIQSSSRTAVSRGGGSSSQGAKKRKEKGIMARRKQSKDGESAGKRKGQIGKRTNVVGEALLVR